MAVSYNWLVSCFPLNATGGSTILRTPPPRAHVAGFHLWVMLEGLVGSPVQVGSSSLVESRELLSGIGIVERCRMSGGARKHTASIAWVSLAKAVPISLPTKHVRPKTLPSIRFCPICHPGSSIRFGPKVSLSFGTLKADRTPLVTRPSRGGACEAGMYRPRRIKRSVNMSMCFQSNGASIEKSDRIAIVRACQGLSYEVLKNHIRFF